MTDKYEVRDDEMDQVVGGLVGGSAASVKATAISNSGNKAATMGYSQIFSENK